MTTKLLTRALTVAALLIASLVGAASATAATVTLGADLATPFKAAVFCPAKSDGTCAIATLQAPSPATATMATSEGTVETWRLEGAKPMPGYSVSVVRKNYNGTWTVTATSAPVTPAGGGIESFATELPIKEGEYVALDLPDEGAVSGLEGSSQIAGFTPAPTLGQTVTAEEGEGGGTVAFNFDLRYGEVPTVTPAPTSSPPPAATPTPEAHCVVPLLRGRRLKAAKKALHRAGCKVGFVVMPDKSSARRQPRVVRTAPGAGRVLPLGTEVSVKLR